MEEWLEPLKDQTVKQGKDKKAVFTCKFSKANCQAKWTWKRDVRLCMMRIPCAFHMPTNLLFIFQEIFQGQKYKMSVEEDGFVHKLYISNPTTDDMGKYSCDISNISTSAYLDVEGKK